MSKAVFSTSPVPEPTKASEGSYIPNRMEDGAIMQRVSRDMYASGTAGLREILANEITAARAAKKLGADPRIEVTVFSHKIMVWGVDSLGMERRVFDDIYTVLGRSGNFDGTTPGQFGLGRAAYVTISDHMLLETHSRNGDRYAVRGIDGVGFEVGLPEPDIPFGTRVTLKPRDWRIPAVEMARLVEAVADRCEIPITLTTDDGTRRIACRPLRAHRQALHARLPDMEFVVGMIDNLWIPDAYLCGIPISFKYRGRYMIQTGSRIKIIVDIRDERKYRPTPDRERMTEEAEVAISDLIDREIDRRLKDFPTDINGAMAHPHRRLAFTLMEGPQVLYTPVNVFDDGRNNAEYAHRGMLGDVTGSPVLSCPVFVGAQTHAVLERYPDAAFVSNAPPGLTTISDFMERHGIEPLLAGRAGPRMVTVHTLGSMSVIDSEHPPEHYTIYRVKGADLHRFLERLGEMPCSNIAALTTDDVKGALDIGDLVAEARGYVFHTSRGTMTGGELADCGADVWETCRRAVVDNWKAGMPDSDAILVWNDGAGGHGRAYRLLWWLARRSVHYVRFTCAAQGRRDWLARVADGPTRTAGGNDWSSMMALETYLRLESPALRRALRTDAGMQDAKFCDGFLALEGKPPAGRDPDCACAVCSRPAGETVS